MSDKLSISKITLTQLRDYVEVAFVDDEDLIKFYDKSVHVEKTQDMVNNTHQKIVEYEEHFKECNSYGLEINNEKVGYFFTTRNPNMLVSFGMNKAYRNKMNLKTMYEAIYNELGGSFHCYLFSHNKRAIKWLERCGMNVSPNEFNNISVLNI